MNILARNQVIGGANPLLVFYYASAGVSFDVYALSFQIFDVSTEANQAAPVQVYPVSAGTKQTIDVSALSPDRLGVGRYAAPWTVPSGQALGAHEIRWFWRSVLGGTEFEARTSFDVATSSPGPLGPLYALPSDLRAEGVTTTKASDVRLLTSLLAASRYVEQVTGRFFSPRYLDVHVDGGGGGALMLPMPIIAIESVGFEANNFYLSDLTPESETYKIYNRHLRGLLNPDDRNNPKIELYGWRDFDRSYLYSWSGFPRGKQNVSVQGVFGYTEADGSPFGQTPTLLRLATQMIAMRNLAKLSSSDRAEAALISRITQESTREQSISYGFNANSSKFIGKYTGDPEIDDLLAMFVRPPMMASV